MNSIRKANYIFLLSLTPGTRRNHQMKLEVGNTE